MHTHERIFHTLRYAIVLIIIHAIPSTRNPDTTRIHVTIFYMFVRSLISNK
jgi:hypothetical protein